MIYDNSRIQGFPALGLLAGISTFTLLVEYDTPAPWSCLGRGGGE